MTVPSAAVTAFIRRWADRHGWSVDAACEWFGTNARTLRRWEEQGYARFSAVDELVCRSPWNWWDWFPEGCEGFEEARALFGGGPVPDRVH